MACFIPRVCATAYSSFHSCVETHGGDIDKCVPEGMCPSHEQPADCMLAASASHPERADLLIARAWLFWLPFGVGVRHLQASKSWSVGAISVCACTATRTWRRPSSTSDNHHPPPSVRRRRKEKRRGKEIFNKKFRARARPHQTRALMEEGTLWRPPRRCPSWAVLLLLLLAATIVPLGVAAEEEEEEGLLTCRPHGDLPG
jgi:hypothetical protein